MDKPKWSVYIITFDLPLNVISSPRESIQLNHAIDRVYQRQIILFRLMTSDQTR